MTAWILRISPTVTNSQLNELFASAWSQHQWRDFQPILARSLLYVGAYADEQLIGFVNLAWDGGIHAFLLDTTVQPAYGRQGLGTQLVQQAVTGARERGIEWVHVDYEPHLRHFYVRCGFAFTEAGLLHLLVG
jgi:GNAT superfamily N-acetyltransferase